MKKLYLSIMLVISSVLCYAQPEIIVPKPHQLKWHEAEMGAVFHYDLHVFDGIRYGQGNNRINPIEDYNIFNPTQLDTDQWIQAAKAAGCKFAVLTATHETGFGLWQSDVNPYCLKAVKWRDGKGDIVRDFVNSCRKYGIQPGIYVGIRWNSLLGIHNFKVAGDGEFAANRQAWYKRYCEKMVEELCTRYGELFMIWFDGGADDPHGDGPDVEPIVNKYQPNCLFYHNVDRADLRWGGSESGTVGYPCWSTFPYPYSHSNATEPNRDHGKLLKHGDPNGRYWVPSMADSPLRGANGRHEWFWEPDDENNIYSVDELMNMYEKSVGRNATLMMGLTPNPDGLIPDEDRQRLMEWGQEINRRFSTPLAQTAGQKKSLVLKLDKKQTVNYCILQEDIAKGERIRQYKVEAKVDGKWKTVCAGQSVGHKRIERFEPVETAVLRLTITEAIAQPEIINFSAYHITPLEQTDYTYEKGKSFKDMPALFMQDSIDLTHISATVSYDRTIPERTQTVAYPVKLPDYVRGIFFSRDSRPGDYEWPNNTNRLLPWTFNHLAELTDSQYPGIPSNAAPSTVGDALLLELKNGEFVFAKAVAGKNSLSWLQVNKNGSITLYVSTLGKDALAPTVPLLLTGQAKSVYETVRKAYQSLIADKEVSSLKSRTEKDYFEAFRYLGWCTWEHYHYDIDENKITNDIEAIEASKIPIRYVLIDDGHLANKNRQLTGFMPDKKRFPSGWGNIISHKKDDKIKWMGLWYSLSGYWMGLSPENDFPTDIQHILYRQNQCLLPGKDSANIRTFYHYYVSSLKEHGFDFLKVDNQAFTLPLYMGGIESIRQAADCNRSLEKEMHRQKMGLMNCMAQNVINTDHVLYSNSTRVSIDYKKYNENMAKSHLFQSYTNTLLLGQTVWPDHDMFHSSDTVCGALMARSKAISGGPVYLSDSPKDFIKEHILPLIDEQGKLFRPNEPAVPMPESVLTNPLWSGKAYRVMAPVGNGALAVICYNLNVSPEFQQVETTLCKDDYYLRGEFAGIPTTQASRILLYDWEKQAAEELSEKTSIQLTGFTDKLFHLCPIEKGWAVIGIQEKYLSPATVEIVLLTDNQLTLNVLCPGVLKVWIEKAGKAELRSISINQPKQIVIYK